MRRLVLGATAAATTLALIQLASAADLGQPVYKSHPPPAPSFSWSGFYLGLNAGGAWGDSKMSSSFTCLDPAQLCNYTASSNLAAVNAAASTTLHNSGFVGGIQAGYNWQTGPWVLGIETDFNSFRLSESNTAGGPFPAAVTNFLTTVSESTNWLYTLRGRVGWSVTPTALLYATGGLALTHGSVGNAFTDNFAAVGGTANTVGASSSSGTWAGVAVGGGLEWALMQGWSVKAEYLFVEFPSKSTTALVVEPHTPPIFPNTLTTTTRLSANIARIGLNYKFGNQ